MNWAWATSLDQLWRSPTFPMWLTLAAAGFFGIIVLVTLWRAEKSVANGALTVITLLAAGIAVAATLRDLGPNSPAASAAETRSPQPTMAALITPPRRPAAAPSSSQTRTGNVKNSTGQASSASI